MDLDVTSLLEEALQQGIWVALYIIPDTLPLVSDGRISIEDAMETAGNRKELEQIEDEAAQAALRELEEPKPLQSERKQTDKLI